MNVTITDVLNNNIVTVQVPLAAAVNICDTDILTVTTGTTTTSTCTATAGSEANN